MQIQRSVQVNITKLYPNPWNPNKRSDRQGKALRESIEKFGQFAEILVRNHPDKQEQYQILDGEHRYRDLLEAGESEVFVNIIEVSDFDARKLTLIANDNGENDRELLAELIAELTESCDGDLEELTEALSLDYEDISALLQYDDEEPEQVEGGATPPRKEVPEDDYSELLGDAAKKVEEARGVAMRGLQVPFPLEEYDRAYAVVKEAHALQISVGAVFVAALESAIAIEKEFKSF